MAAATDLTGDTSLHQQWQQQQQQVALVHPVAHVSQMQGAVAARTCSAALPSPVQDAPAPQLAVTLLTMSVALTSRGRLLEMTRWMIVT